MTTTQACEPLGGVAEAPASPAQQGLWLLHQLRPADASNHVCYTLDWPRPVRADVLGAALDDLVARHEALRTAVTLRDRPEFEPLIGYGLNTVVLRAGITGAESFAELVDQVRDGTLDAFEHRDLPFELVVRELSPRRAPGIMPLINVAFGYSSRGGGRAAGPAAAGIVVREVDTGGTRVDLTLGIEDDAGELRGTAEYDLGLFRRGTIERLCGGLPRLIEAAVADPDVPVSRLLSDPEPRPP